MQALGLLDRSIKAATDDEITSSIEALDDDHREGLESFVEGELDADSLRAGVKAGRIDGSMEAIAAILSDACLADCIEVLGENADNPSTDQLQDVLPDSSSATDSPSRASCWPPPSLARRRHRRSFVTC